MGEIIVPLIVMTIVAISYVIQLLSKLQQKPGQRPGPPGGQKGPLEDEIGDFLRKASGKQRQSHPPSRRPTQVERLQDEDRLVEADILEPQPGHSRESIAEKPSSQFDSHLGEAVFASETQLENHLHSTFDHHVGQLEQTSGDSDQTVEATEVTSPQALDADTPSMAASLAGVFSRPESIRQAVLLQEILQRPEHRWK